MEYRVCSRCVMDTSDKEIVFDKDGVCNHCRQAEQSLIQLKKQRDSFDLKGYCGQIKEAGKGRKYDCVVGISGGVDSCYVMYLVKSMGLNPLAVHIDNGWDSELAVQNIRMLLEKLEVDLYTYVVDWQEFRDLQLAFLKASTPDSEIPTDHMIFPVLGMVAHKYKCKYIIMGHNSASESVLPRTWSHGHFDWKYIKAIHKQFGTVKMKTFPHFTRFDLDYFLRKFVWFNILDYIDYDKEAAKKFLMSDYGWRDYGGKHYESFYTKFFQTYILPVKFGYDKRRAHYSSLIMAGQMNRQEALDLLQGSPYKEEELERDIEYIAEKLQITKAEFEEIMSKEPKSYWDYPNQENDWMAKLADRILRGKKEHS